MLPVTSWTIRTLSRISTAPTEVEIKMRKVIETANLVTIATTRADYFEKMIKHKIGTNEVEKMAARLCHRGQHALIERERDIPMIMTIMRQKLQNTIRDKQQANNRFQQAKGRLWRHISPRSNNGTRFLAALRAETNYTWRKDKDRLKAKLAHLMRKHAPILPGTFRDIKVGDEELGENIPPAEPLIWGPNKEEVASRITPGARKILNLPPQDNNI